MMMVTMLVMIQMILVNCISSMRKNFMQLSNICIYQYFIFGGLIVMYVGTSELNFCSPH